MAIPEKSQPRLITGEELARHPEWQPCELVDGRIVPVTRVGFRHGEIAFRLVARLGTYAEESDRGRVAVGDVGVYTRHNPDSVRGADIVFISHERFAQRRSQAFLDATPELVVEIFSPDDRWVALQRKAQEYLAAGVLRVWLVHPEKRQVLVCRPTGQPKTLGIGDTLSDEEILPGFSLSLSELFRD